MALLLTVCLLLLLQVSSHHATATVVLDSSVACPGETVTYTCTVNQGAFLDWIVEPFLPDSARIQFTSTTSTGTNFDCSGVASVQCTDFDFVATLTDIANPTPVPTGTLADMTSTLTFTATASLNGTVVQCRGTTAAGFPITNRTLNIAGLPSPPRTPSITVQQYGRDSVTLTVQWQPPQYDGGAPVNYTITVSPGLSPVTTSGPSVPVTLPYNLVYTVSIMATNCNGSSSAAMETIRVVNCSDPTPPGNGSIETYQNTTEGAEIFFRCNPGFVPAGRMRAVCASDGRWSPDPANFMCTFSRTVCENPVTASGVTLLQPYTTTVSSVIVYQCQQSGLVPSAPSSVCEEDGMWSPHPSQVTCMVTTVTTMMPPASSQGLPVWLIAVIAVIGVLLLASIIIGIVICCCKCGCCKSKDEPNKFPMSPTVAPKQGGSDDKN